MICLAASCATNHNIEHFVYLVNYPNLHGLVVKCTVLSHLRRFTRTSVVTEYLSNVVDK